MHRAMVKDSDLARHQTTAFSRVGDPIIGVL